MQACPMQICVMVLPACCCLYISKYPLLSQASICMLLPPLLQVIVLHPFQLSWLSQTSVVGEHAGGLGGPVQTGKLLLFTYPLCLMHAPAMQSSRSGLVCSCLYISKYPLLSHASTFS